MSIIVGYLGPSGSFSDAVRKHLYPEDKYSEWIFKPHPTLADIINALENNEISLAVFPIESSKTGLLIDDQDGIEFLEKLAAPHSNLYIIGERFWLLNFLLLSHPDASIDKIKVVHLNPYMQEQCRKYLSAHPMWQMEKHPSSSEAARIAKQKSDPTHAAIASEEAADVYGLNILENKLFDENNEPIMHFLVLGNMLSKIFVQTKTIDPISCFAIKSTAINEFKNFITDQKLEISMSRKSKRLQHYFVDIEGELSPKQMNHLLDNELMMKFLGTFKSCPNRKRYQHHFHTDE